MEAPRLPSSSGPGQHPALALTDVARYTVRREYWAIAAGNSRP